MERLNDTTSSTLGRTVALRFGQLTFQALKEHLRNDQSEEQFGFALFSYAKAADSTVLQVRNLMFPSSDDLEEQTGGSVAPAKQFQSFVYLTAQQAGLGILDIHTHPFRGHSAVQRH